MITHLKRQRNWSLTKFGGGFRLAGIIQHITKELEEIKANPHDVEEWADLLILAFDGAMRSGASPEEILEAIRAKQQKNESREWPDYKNYSQNEAITHVKDWPAGVHKAGTIVRYGTGSTALLRVDSVITGGRDGFRYYGRQCMGGNAGAYHSDCWVASKEDVELFRSYLPKEI